MRNKTGLILLSIVAIFVTIGAVMIYSSSGVYAGAKYNNSIYFFRKQMVWILISSCFFVMGAGIDYRIFMKYSRWMMVVSVILLVATLIVGNKVGGARRWISLAGITFQPSEMVKIAVILYVADFMSRKQMDIKSFFKGYIPVLMVIGICSLLILKQPDLGTVILIGAVSFIMFFVGGVRIPYLVSTVLMALPVLYHFIFKVEYRRKRILAFLNPWDDPQGISFQIVQSFIALGCGGLKGVGLGQSRQKLFYLPEAHTDFIYSIIGEEFGFLGCMFVLGLFVLFFIVGLRIVFKATDLKAYLLSLGITSMIFLQSVINMGVVSGAFPTKGMPLPFISFGGTNLVVVMFGAGILMNISRMEFPQVQSATIKRRNNTKITNILAKASVN